MPRRCVFGCPPGEARMHCFPNPTKHLERFKVWVQRVGGKLETELDFEHYKNQRICDLHFTERDKNRYNRLNALAVPLPYSVPGTSLNQSVIIPENHNNTDEPLVPLDLNAGTSLNQSVAIPENHNNTDEALISLGLDTGTSLNQPIIIPKNLNNTDEALAPLNLNAGSISNTACAAYIIKEHNYSVISRPERKIIKQDSHNTAVFNCSQTKSLRTEIKYLRNEVSRLRKKGRTFKQRLDNAEKLSMDKAFNRVVKNMTMPARLFVHMQLQTKKKSKGRRFTIQEKVLSLSLYKRSPKGYALLNKYFILPSVKAMKRLLAQVKLRPGINKIIFEKLKKTVMQKDKCDRLCSIIFDEMSLTPQIFYNAAKDTFEGFTTNCGQKFADHALVFMVKGLNRNYKQPIAYFFTNCLNKIELKSTITNVIKHAQDSGLIIINTVCDQSTINVSAITELVNETKQNYLRLQKEWRHDLFCVNGQNIIPIYDTPHLIKGIRNNLMTKDLRYTTNNQEKVIKWKYFEMVYHADKTYGELRLLNKITEEHINIEKMNKMRVKLATQLFSHSVAVVTEHLTARGDLPEECRQLIEFTLLIDNLFDTLNVSNFHIPNGKKYKGPIKRHSPHHKFWQDAKKVLNTVKFIETKRVGDKIQLIERNVPSVVNLIKTINGVEAIWKLLSQKYACDILLTRNLNQDPVENFFGNIRSYGARNIAPNTVSFEGAFKALLLNNFNSLHSIRANCEDDDNKCLQTLDFFLTNQTNEITSDVSTEDTIHFNNDILNIEESQLPDAGQRNYVCGWILKKCLKFVKTCKNCKETLLDSDNSNHNNPFTQRKEYCNKKWLCYPSIELENCFHNLQKIVLSVIQNNPPMHNIKRTILSFSDILIEFPFQCPVHKEEFKKIFENTTVALLLHSWCRSINRILSGKIVYTGNDKLKVAAQHYYNKRKHYKNKK